MATRADVKRACRYWAHALPIGEWDVVIDWNTPCDETKYATIQYHTDGRHAEIRLDTDWRSWPLERVSEIVCHELLHLCVRDLVYVSTHLAAEQLPEDAGAIIYKAACHEEELLVFSLAGALASAFPLSR